MVNEAIVSQSFPTCFHPQGEYDCSHAFVWPISCFRRFFIIVSTLCWNILPWFCEYSFEFATTSVHCDGIFDFGEGQELVTMTIAQCGRDVLSVKSSVLLCPPVLSAVSLEPFFVCCAGKSTDFIRELDKAPSQKAEIQYPFNLLPLQIAKINRSRALLWWAKLTSFR